MLRISLMLRAVSLAGLGFACLAPVALAANATLPGTVTSYATIQCAGVEWRIAGDDNRNAVVTTEYRRSGATSWKPAQPLWRVATGLWRHGEDPGNLLAGSLFFLDPGSTYDIRLTLSDPDGGATQRTVSVTTRSEPRPARNARVRYVSPGSGGGTGTSSDPFRGLPAADAAAAPGDVFLLRTGTYATPFVPTRDGTAQSPIVYLGSSAGSVVLDGNGGTSGGSHCVDLTNRHYVFIEKMTLRNCLRPVIVEATTGVVMRGCTIAPIGATSDYGILGHGVHDLFVADNTITMTGDWRGVGRTGAYGNGGYGVEVTGDDIVLCYNHVIESWDGLDVGAGDGTGLRTFNADVYGNFVDRASDDACQTDAVHQNIRVFRNRFLNSGSPTSCQPSFGGPVYLMFNELINVRTDPFKFHQETFYFGAADPQETSGMLVFHNTGIGSKSGWYESGLWQDVKLRNNLLIGARPNLYSLYIPGGQHGDLDHDGYNRQQSNLVKYNGTAFANLPALAAGTGNESHGLEVTLGAFVRAAYPVHPEWDAAQGYGAPNGDTDMDLRLAASSVAVDRGQPLANIDDGYSGVAPDLGCYEQGSSMPWYGPRPGATLDVPIATGESRAALRLSPPAPNPSSAAFSFVIESTWAEDVTVRVVDIGGRIVRVLGVTSPATPGPNAMRWDGRDTAGVPVPTGIYRLVARSGAETRMRSVVVVH